MKLRVFLAAAVALVTLAACGDTEGDSDTASDNQVTMLLSYQESIYWLPLLMAKDQGYFEEEGIDLKVEATEGSGFVTQQVIAGNVDFGWAGAADDVIAFSKDDQIRTLICNPPQNIFRIVVAEDSDITDFSQIEGKTLGITEAGGGEEPIVDAALGDLGLEKGKDVKILPIGAAGPQSLSAILDGTVDAYASSYPDISTLAAEGLKTRDITPAKFNAVPGDCLVTRQEVLETEEGKAAALAIMRAWAKGFDYAKADPARALDISCKIVPAECSDMAFAEQYLLDTLKIAEQEDPNAPFGSVPTTAWETTAQLLLDSGTISGSVDVRKMTQSPEISELLTEYVNY